MLCCFMIPRHPRSTLFPYTTLFRSHQFALATPLRLRPRSRGAPDNAEWPFDDGGWRSAVLERPFSVIGRPTTPDRKSTRLNSSHSQISYAVFCLKKKTPKLSSASAHTDSTSSPNALLLHDPSTPTIHALSLHDALPISPIRSGNAASPPTQESWGAR